MSNPRRSQPARRALVRGLVPALLLAACATSEPGSSGEQDVARLVAQGRYEEAVQRAAAEHQADPADELALRNYRMATAAWYLERGRRAAFQGEDFVAMEHFQAAREAAPEAPEVNAWIQKTNNNLAEHYLSVALEAHIRDDLPAASEAYENVLIYRPGDLHAGQGLGRVLLQLNHRQGMGDAYYDEGVRSLAEYWLYEAKSRFGYVKKYLPDDQPSANRTEEVDALLADSRAAIAAGLDAQGRFAAARNEYRLALTLDPEHAGAQAGFERSGTEARASEILSHGQMLILRERFDEAEATLREGLELTERQRDLFEGALVELEQGRFSEMYARARGLESDNRFVPAVAAYDDLLDQAEYYEDAIARRHTLESFISDAERFYAQIEASDDPEEILGLLRRIDVFWPEFRDVKARLAALEARDEAGAE